MPINQDVEPLPTSTKSVKLDRLWSRRSRGSTKIVEGEVVWSSAPLGTLNSNGDWRFTGRLRNWERTMDEGVSTIWNVSSWLHCFSLNLTHTRGGGARVVIWIRGGQQPLLLYCLDNSAFEQFGSFKQNVSGGTEEGNEEDTACWRNPHVDHYAKLNLALWYVWGVRR